MASTGETKSANLRRIFIVDDHPIAREGFAAHLATVPGLTLCSEAEGVPQAMAKIPDAKPDLVIVDLSLDNGNGIDLIKRLIARDASLRILVWSMHSEKLYAERALRAGAKGYVDKAKSADKVLEAVRTVLAGKIYLSDDLAESLLGRIHGNAPKQSERSEVETLTDRELEAFEFMGHGLTSSEIAARMHVSPKTVDTYRARIKQKLGLKNVSELIQRATQWVMEQNKN